MENLLCESTLLYLEQSELKLFEQSLFDSGWLDISCRFCCLEWLAVKQLPAGSGDQWREQEWRGVVESYAAA
jgi:hypothetical protein